jgi:hypothetical protein
MAQTTSSVLTPDRRQHVVNQIFDVLKDWRASPFENEGSCTAGLRSALCMDGHKWVLADVEAQAVVGEALRLLGAERPTWEEGQRAYSGGADYCAWCGIDIPDDVRSQRGGYSYCSKLCATRARLFNEDEHSDQKDRIGDQAYRVVRKGRSTSIICKGCGKPFQPDPANRNPKYCSHRCYTNDKRVLPERACQQCGKGFRPRRVAPNALFCSHECHLAFAHGSISLAIANFAARTSRRIDRRALLQRNSRGQGGDHQLSRHG